MVDLCARSQPMSARHLLHAGVALLSLMLISAPAAAGGGWSTPRDVDDDPQLTVQGRPAIALHEAIVHIAVAGAEGRRGIRLESVEGSTTTVHQVTTRNDRQPSLAISDAGVLHIAFSRRRGACDDSLCTKGIFYARSADGADWAIERVHRGDHDVHPSIALDPQGRPWIYFRSGSRIFEAQRTGGGWSNAFVAFGCCGPDPLAGPEAVVAGGQGRERGGGPSPHLRVSVYRQGDADGRIVIDFFELDTVFSDVVTEADDALDPDIVIDNRFVHVVYRREGDGLWYARIAQNGTIERTQVAGAEVVDAPSIATLPDGRVIIVAAANGKLIYRTNATGDWTGDPIPGTGISEARPASGLAGDPTWPVVATTDAGAARVAFLRDEGADRGLWLVKRGASWSAMTMG